MSTWIEEEFNQINFGDTRIDKRFKTIAQHLADKPAGSIHSASPDWAATKAAYRFFDNEDVSSNEISSTHIEATALRCQKFKKIVVAQDTTYIDFNSHKKTKNLGKSFKSHGETVRGICMHAGLAMTEKGLPLGLLYNKLWIRKENHISQPDRNGVPIQLKESHRWIECLKNCKKYLNEEQSVVVVADREGDFYEIFESAYKCEVDVIVRSSHNRMIEDEYRLDDFVGLLPVKGLHTIVIPSNGSRLKKTAKLEIRFDKVELLARPNVQKTQQNKHRQDIELFVVDATDGELHWRLLTTLPVNTLSDAIEILNFYKMRWNVETYFKTLKTGCTVEKCRLEDGGKLIKYIALMSVIGWRLFWMTYISREEPNISCEVALTSSEWKAGWLMLHKDKIKNKKMQLNDMPTTPPTMQEAVRLIAMCGGFLGRKGDGVPGIITFWRGWLRVLNGVEIYELLT